METVTYDTLSAEADGAGCNANCRPCNKSTQSQSAKAIYQKEIVKIAISEISCAASWGENALWRRRRLCGNNVPGSTSTDLFPTTFSDPSKAFQTETFLCTRRVASENLRLPFPPTFRERTFPSPVKIENFCFRHKQAFGFLFLSHFSSSAVVIKICCLCRKPKIVN